MKVVNGFLIIPGTRKKHLLSINENILRRARQMDLVKPRLLSALVNIALDHYIRYMEERLGPPRGIQGEPCRFDDNGNFAVSVKISETPQSPGDDHNGGAAIVFNATATTTT